MYLFIVWYNMTMTLNNNNNIVLLYYYLIYMKLKWKKNANKVGFRAAVYTLWLMASTVSTPGQRTMDSNPGRTCFLPNGFITFIWLSAVMQVHTNRLIWNRHVNVFTKCIVVTDRWRTFLLFKNAAEVYVCAKLDFG